MAVLEIHHLSKSYGPVRAVQDLSFAVDRGEVFGYLGPNGSGKTTTLRCVMGLLKLSAGEIRLFGERVQFGAATGHTRLGYLPGDFRIWQRMTARQALDALGRFGGGVEHRARRDELAERLELSLDRKVGDLSKGNRQKVGLVMAFQHDPDLLLLDEPTSGLDPLVRQTVLELILEAAARGATIILSSHDLAEVTAACGRAAILRQGQLVRVAPITELLAQSSYHLKVWFAGEAEPFPRGRFPDATVLEERSRFLHLECQGGSADALLKWVARFPVERIATPEPTLEEAFMVYYSEDGSGGGGTRP